MFGIASVLCSVKIGSVVESKTIPKSKHVIVIDAGHGGVDGGAVGKKTGVKESDLNLIYALELGKICESFDFQVVQSRKDKNGLYSSDAKSKKKSEMENRKKIIQNSNPDVVVSIHMNSFSSQEVSGAQVYYAKGNEAGKSLAENIQNVFYGDLDNANETAKVGDYYVLNCTSCPSVLIECGFLSNMDEEVLLQNEDYIHRVCYDIVCGILLYLKM